ncbi:hypothetical protein NECAME_19295 [Necator americanus]|uniref:Uncharacterized protein n=1 Tax=Necator americanus TaxID=51031 RepID=W2SPD7_NECAM|nr:hypothetical protein NECAME_19295 [Necator americanus]ETN71510.1 hypothetical protein NECAME_19295 [Necator americanus]
MILLRPACPVHCLLRQSEDHDNVLFASALWMRIVQMLSMWSQVKYLPLQALQGPNENSRGAIFAQITSYPDHTLLVRSAIVHKYCGRTPNPLLFCS